MFFHGVTVAIVSKCFFDPLFFCRISHLSLSSSLSRSSSSKEGGRLKKLESVDLDDLDDLLEEISAPDPTVVCVYDCGSAMPNFPSPSPFKASASPRSFLFFSSEICRSQRG